MLKKKKAFVVDQAFVKCEVNHPRIFNDPKCLFVTFDLLASVFSAFI